MNGDGSRGRAGGRAALLEQLSRIREIDRVVAARGGPPPRARLLALWQSRRLAVTYEDFSAQRRYAGAAQFFLEDLYGPHDFSQRDQDVEKVFPVMSRMLPAGALDALTMALELHVLTQDLDAAMLETLERDLGMGDSLDARQWCEAYRACDRAADRRRQIALTARIGKVLDEVVRKPLIYGLVRIARGPAHAAGFGELQEFVERGFRAFREMQGARVFIDTVARRETEIMERLFAGETPEPWIRRPGRVHMDELGFVRG